MQGRQTGEEGRGEMRMKATRSNEIMVKTINNYLDLKRTSHVNNLGQNLLLEMGHMAFHIEGASPCTMHMPLSTSSTMSASGCRNKKPLE